MDSRSFHRKHRWPLAKLIDLVHTTLGWIVGGWLVMLVIEGLTGVAR